MRSFRCFTVAAVAVVHAAELKPCCCGTSCEVGIFFRAVAQPERVDLTGRMRCADAIIIEKGFRIQTDVRSQPLVLTGRQLQLG